MGDKLYRDHKIFICPSFVSSILIRIANVQYKNKMKLFFAIAFRKSCSDDPKSSIAVSDIWNMLISTGALGYPMEKKCRKLNFALYIP